MGSDETASTIPGGLEKLTFFTGTGRHRAQIARFFRMQIGSWTPSGMGLVVGKSPAPHTPSRQLGPPRIWKPKQTLVMVRGAAVVRENGRLCLSGGACGVGLHV